MQGGRISAESLSNKEHELEWMIEFKHTSPKSLEPKEYEYGFACEWKW
jgi:hypothetical protein